MTSSAISAKPVSLRSTSMTGKREPSVLTRRMPRRSCPRPETAVTTESRSSLRKSTPTAIRLPGFFISSLKMSQSVLLPPGPFTDTSRSGHYHVQRYHYRRRPGQSLPPVVRDAEGRMVWRAWNFEPYAGEGLNRYIRRSGIRDTFTR